MCSQTETYHYRLGVWKCHRRLPPDPGPTIGYHVWTNGYTRFQSSTGFGFGNLIRKAHILQHQHEIQLARCRLALKQQSSTDTIFNILDESRHHVFWSVSSMDPGSVQLASRVMDHSQGKWRILWEDVSGPEPHLRLHVASSCRAVMKMLVTKNISLDLPLPLSR